MVLWKKTYQETRVDCSRVMVGRQKAPTERHEMNGWKTKEWSIGRRAELVRRNTELEVRDGRLSCLPISEVRRRLYHDIYSVCHDGYSVCHDGYSVCHDPVLYFTVTSLPSGLSALWSVHRVYTVSACGLHRVYILSALWNYIEFILYPLYGVYIEFVLYPLYGVCIEFTLYPHCGVYIEFTLYQLYGEYIEFTRCPLNEVYIEFILYPLCGVYIEFTLCSL